jgi:hypothetical protein
MSALGRLRLIVYYCEAVSEQRAVRRALRCSSMSPYQASGGNRETWSHYAPHAHAKGH